MEHIVKSFDEELLNLKQDILRMGGLAEQQLAAAIEGLSKRDVEKCQDVRERDKELDVLDNRIEMGVVKLIALRQPMADDLRSCVAALKISNDLERIGDYAANVAKRAQVISRLPLIEPVRQIPRMGRLVRALINDTMDGYASANTEKLVDVWHRDEEVDALYTALFRELLTYMMEDPRTITAGTHILFIAKNIERMGDHTTNIAEEAYYAFKGERLEGKRPKGDSTSTIMVDPKEVFDTPEAEGEK